jgi:hypothetical protein
MFTVLLQITDLQLLDIDPWSAQFFLIVLVKVSLSLALINCHDTKTYVDLEIQLKHH